MKIAVVLTVKNEARLIKQNVYYHLGIGVSRIFIYFDGTEDDGRSLVQGINGVECLDSVTDERYDHLPFLHKFTKNKKDHHSARQCLNSYDAEQKCLTMNIDWLISIDADEFFLPFSYFNKSLDDFFKEMMHEQIDLVRMEVYEVIPRQMHYQHVSIEETHFKTKKNFQSKFDQIYFQITNPYTKLATKSLYWVSHNMGKCAIKVGSDLIPHNVHKYKPKDSSKIVKKIYAGHILHYFQYDVEDFIKKSQNFKFRPNYYLSGKKIGNLKELFRTVVNDPNKSTEDISEFYRKNLFFDKKKMRRLYKTRFFNILPRKEKAVIEINKPKEVLEPYRHLL